MGGCRKSPGASTIQEAEPMQFRISEWSRKFWSDETGFVVSAELALIATLGIVGATVGIESLS